MLGHFFFEPLQLNFEPTDLLVEFRRLRLVGVGRLRLLAVLVFEPPAIKTTWGQISGAISPEVEAKAAALRIQSGISTLPLEWSKLGRDPEVELRCQAEFLGVDVEALKQALFTRMFGGGRTRAACATEAKNSLNLGQQGFY